MKKLNHIRTAEFNDLYFQLPSYVRKQALFSFRRFLHDSRHPSLRLHPLKNNKKGKHLPGSMSVSISLSYRAIYRIMDDKYVWYWIGSHADYDTFIGG